MVPIESLFARLQRSTFRSRFRLGVKERQYCYDKGAEVIDQHAADFIASRLAPAQIPNDGKQTPMRGHPVEEQRYVVQVIHHWLVIQMNSPDRSRL
ncbi:MAG: DUF4186 family protein [Klebsiella michiganensis]|nr:DUF4186 family protein [Klebsiella michiganensis]